MVGYFVTCSFTSYREENIYSVFHRYIDIMFNSESTELYIYTVFWWHGTEFNFFRTLSSTVSYWSRWKWLNKMWAYLISSWDQYFIPWNLSPKQLRDVQCIDVPAQRTQRLKSWEIFCDYRKKSFVFRNFMMDDWGLDTTYLSRSSVLVYSARSFISLFSENFPKY